MKEKLYAEILKNFGVGKLVADILYERGYDDFEKVSKFITCDYLQDSTKINDICKGAEELVNAIKNKIPIIIHGDYDVDGISSTAIMFDFIYHEIGYTKIFPYIPKRKGEGYGISDNSMNSISSIVKDKFSFDVFESKVKPLVISVDCGIKDVELIDGKWHEWFDFIITDHHDIPKNEEFNNLVSIKAKAIIHPRHDNSSIDFKDVCGAAVTYKFIEVVNSIGKFEANIQKYMPLVALATNCDVMPLIDENRRIVKSGLKEMQNTSILGVNALIDSSGIDKNEINTYHLGFILGPRINASGRIGNPMDAVRLLVTKDFDIARNIAKDLSILNQKRQEITRNRMYDAEKQVDLQLSDGCKAILVSGVEWEEGIVGLIAGKLCEKHSMPTFAFSIDNDKCVGSARSVEGINIIENLKNCSNLLLKFGGHSGAAGLTLQTSNLELFRKKINQVLTENLSTSILNQEIKFDAKICLNEINEDLLSQLQILEPFGFGNENPLFQTDNCTLEGINYMGGEKQHVRLSVIDDSIKIPKNIIFFNATKELMDLKIGDKKKFIVNVSTNVWNGVKSIQIIGKESF